MPLDTLDYRELGKDIYAEARDGELTEDEREEILTKYEAEKCQVQDEACANLQELKDALDIFKEIEKLGRGAIKKFQMIISIPKNSRDGIFGPGSFQKFMQYRNETGFTGGIEELLSRYTEYKDTFTKLPIQQRKQLQPAGGKDGKFGQGTFKHMLLSSSVTGKEEETPLIERADEVIDAIESAPLQGDIAVEDKTELQQQEEPVYNNGLQMTDEQFSAARLEARESGTNPSYQEFRTEVRKLSRKEKIQLQEVVGASIDGNPGLGTYTHYLHSKIKEAGFSISEAASFKKVLSQGAEDEISQIQNTYDVNFSELPVSVSQGDFLKYDSDYGELTIISQEDGSKTTVDVAEGIFDTIENSFKENDSEKLFQTLSQFSRRSEKKQLYISEIQKYIEENGAYEQARIILCSTDVSETENGKIYTVDFKGDRELSAAITAMDIFGDQEFLLDMNNTYIRRYEPKSDFKTYQGRRLSISSGTSVMIPNAQRYAEIKTEVETIERNERIKQLVENNIAELIRESDKESFLAYLELDSISDRDKDRAISSLKKVSFNERLFSNMREMFTTSQDNGILFTPENELLAQKLGAIDIFGDYKALISQENTYLSIRESKYTNGGEKLKLIAGETLVQIDESSLRTSEDYRTLAEGIHPELAGEFGRWLEGKRLGTAQGMCARGVADLCQRYGIRVDRGHARQWDNNLDARVAEGQFRKVKINHPKEAKAGGIVCYNQGADRGSSDRKTFGHVEICDGKGNYYYDGKTNIPAGSCYKGARNRTEKNIISGKTSNSSEFMRLTAFTGYVYYPVRKR